MCHMTRSGDAGPAEALRTMPGGVFCSLFFSLEYATGDVGDVATLSGDS